jgi:hypothetical protein
LTLEQRIARGEEEAASVGHRHSRQPVESSIVKRMSLNPHDFWTAKFIRFLPLNSNLLSARNVRIKYGGRVVSAVWFFLPFFKKKLDKLFEVVNG